MTTFELIIAIITALVGAGVFSGMFYIGRKMGGYDVRMDQFEKRMDQFEKRMDQFEKRMDQFEKRMEQFEKRMDQLENKLNSIIETIANLPCASHGTLIQQVKEDNLVLKKSLEKISSLIISHETSIQVMKEDIVTIKITLGTHGNAIQQMKEDIVAVKTFLMTKNPKSSQTFSQKNSPTELNTAGLLLFENLEGKPFLDDNEELFFKAIADKNPKTHLDIETYAFEVLIENANNDIFNNMKDIIYNMLSMEIKKGDEIEKYNVTMNDACYILSIELRNRYIAKFPFSKT